MIQWSERPSEVRNLLNPAFCARILYVFCAEYEKNAKGAIPFPLIYLVLPLVLHKRTREIISSRTSFTNWLQENGQVKIGFGRRAKELVPITNEAIELLLQSQKIYLNSDGFIKINEAVKKLSRTRFIDSEVKECIIKAEHVARWFASTDKVEMIYINLGVRP